MRAKLLKGAGLVAVVAAFGLVCITGSRAQPTANQSTTSVTTNWVGCLVVGKKDPLDQMGGIFPSPVQQVQIGLRSDGVVIWRSAPPK